MKCYLLIDFNAKVISSSVSFELTENHKEILLSREQEANTAQEPGLTWEQVKKSII